VFEPGCERSVATADAVNLSALEAAIFRDLPALLSTVRWLKHSLSCLFFRQLDAQWQLSHIHLQMLVKELHDVDSSTRLARAVFRSFVAGSQRIPLQPAFALELHFS
jgi:hypothetical protein